MYYYFHAPTECCWAQDERIESSSIAELSQAQYERLRMIIDLREADEEIFA